MDKVDHLIIQELTKNSKLGVKELAVRIGLTSTPTYERVKRLERTGVIEGYTIRINKKKIGKSLQVLCYISLKEHKLGLLEQFEQKIVSLPEVDSCYHIAGDHDYAIIVEVADMDAYETFLRGSLASIPSIGNVKSSFVMNEIRS